MKVTDQCRGQVLLGNWRSPADSARQLFLTAGGIMSEAATATTESACVLVAIPVGRTGWVRREVMLHYQASRLIKAEGIELSQTGPSGLTGTLYVVRESCSRDNRLFMRLERQKI